MLIENPQPNQRFYHSFDFPDRTVSGDWDLRGRFDEYIGQVQVRGRTLLDVGAASGFLSFEAEKRGAHVTSFDADSADRWQLGPGECIDYAYYEAMRNSYSYAHAALRSGARAIYGNVYSMADAVEPHDIVLIGQILVHLRDPIAAIEQSAKCAKQTIIIAEGMMDTEEPTAIFTAGRPGYSWWYMSRGIYRQWLVRLGFEVKAFSEAKYRCVVRDEDIAICSLVAERVAPTPQRPTP